jgi:hypothetical protein
VHLFPTRTCASRGRPGSTGCCHGPCPVEVCDGVHRRYLVEHAHGKARFGNAQAIIRCSGPVQLRWRVRIFCLQSRQSARCRRGPRAFDEWRIDGLVPVICPTCQMFSKHRLCSLAGPGYFAWGRFRYLIGSGYRAVMPLAFPMMIGRRKLLVPLAGIEPALLAELDFESSASTNSATGAFRTLKPSRGQRREAGGI